MTSLRKIIHIFACKGAPLSLEREKLEVLEKYTLFVSPQNFPSTPTFFAILGWIVFCYELMVILICEVYCFCESCCYDNDY